MIVKAVYKQPTSVEGFTKASTNSTICIRRDLSKSTNKESVHLSDFQK